MTEHKEDERFAHILSDPKLQQIKLKEQKYKIDKRFQSLITSSKSKQKCLIDKRGRPMTAVSKSGFSRFYDLSDSEEEEHGSQTVVCSKGKKEQDSFEKKYKKEKQEKANKVKKEMKERSILKTISDGEDDDDEQSVVEQKMELDVSAEEEENETEEDEEEATEDDNEEDSANDDDDDDDDDDDEQDSEEDKSSSNRHRKKKGDVEPDYSRGIGNISSSSDEEDDDDSEEVEDSHARGPVAAIHPWAEMIEKEVPVVDQSTRRLAICNMNWDYVTAQDLMMLCNSFKPQHGTVFSVMIYPTEFGIERMTEECRKGPKEITEVKHSRSKGATQSSTKADAEEIERTNAGPSKEKVNKVTKEKRSTDERNSETVRRYELNRLRYFFAVVECDSVETADLIYTNCDGMEFEKSGTKLDFRYIPDEEVFNYEPKSVATSLPASGTYKPPHFVDAAVSRTDVKLSWDRTSHRRLAVTQMDFRKVKNIDELEDQFLEYIAPYTSEEEEEGDEPYPDLDWSYIPGELPAKWDVQDMKSTLLEPKIEEKEENVEGEEADEEEEKSDDDQVHMEFSWDIGLKDTLEGTAKEKKKKSENAKLTPWEQYKKNKKDKKRQKEREKKRKPKVLQKGGESDKIKETSAELDSFFLPDNSSDEEKEKPKRQKESLKQRARKKKREAEEQHLDIDQSVLSDPRFADLAKKDFALDPSAPEFRKRRRKI